MILQVAAVAGCGAGAGLLLLGRALAPARRVDAVEAIRRLSAAAAPATPSGLAGRLTGSRTVQALASGTLLSIPRSDLALLGAGPEGYVAYRLATAAVGLAIGPILGALALVLGLHLPLAIPAAAALAVGAVLFFTSSADFTGKAATARRDAQYQLLALLDATALEISGSSSPLQAIEDAAAALEAWCVVRVRDTLTRAQMGGHAPWDALERLGRELSLPVLVETSNMLRASDAEGAGAHARLTARAESLRAELQAGEEAAANSASERMVLPMTMLVVLFMILVSYPLVTRIR